MHLYRRDLHSGAGNCACGAQERHRCHPHEFMLSGTPGINTCVCALPYWAPCHKEIR